MILHIPHSSVKVKHFNEYTDLNWALEQNNVTDHKTDELFHCINSEKIVFNYSRLWCDVERFPDEKEPLHELGRGIITTKVNNKIIRTPSKSSATDAKNDYNKWHFELNKTTDRLLSLFSKVVIVDCHSYDGEGPDICIGTTHNTSKKLLNEVIESCKNVKYTYDINSPFEGAMVPSMFSDNENVESIMLEVNKRIYKTSKNFDTAKQHINIILNAISKYEDSYEKF